MEITPTYRVAECFPGNLATIVMVAAFVAGPENRKTKAVPGLIPLATRLAARGVEAVAQM